MIEAKEIRVGNLFIREIKSNRGLEYDNEFILSENEIGKLFGDSFELALNDLSPIPLTEEWLVKFGWNDENKFEFFGFLGLLKETDDKFKICYCGSESLVVYNKEIKYVHQLQNLYFALTGEELTLKQTQP